MYPDIILQHFKQVFGHQPELLVRAPGRINIIGEHTDYNEGLVLPAAIDKSIYFALSPRTDGRIELHSTDLKDHYSAALISLAPAEKMWPNYLLGVINELQASGFHPGGVNVVFGGDLPSGAGLSSSAAIETGMLFALNQLFSLGLFKLDVVKLAQKAENHFVGMQCGIMDMFATVMGRAERAIRLDCRSLDFDYYPFETEAYKWVLLNSGVKHSLVNSAYNTRRAECEEGLALLQEYEPSVYALRDVSSEIVRDNRLLLPENVYQRCLYVTEEIERVEAACLALEISDWDQLGQLLYSTHEGLQRQYQVSCVELDFLVDQTRTKNEVLGARMMGGGFGGCTLNLVQESAVPDFIQQMETAYAKQFGISLESHIVQFSEGVGEVDF